MKSHKSEYNQVIKNRFDFINDRITKEKEENARLKFF